MPTVTPEKVTPAETMAPAVSEEPAPTVSPEMEASTAETTSPAVSPNVVAENQSDFKVKLGSEDGTPAVRQNAKGQLCLYFYADGVEENQEIKWWKKTNDDTPDENVEPFMNGNVQSSKVDENIVLTATNDYVIFFTIGDSKEPSQSISVLENKLLTVKVTVKENNEVLSYEAINGFKDLVNYYTIVWETYDESTGEWEEAGTDETLTLTGKYENKRIRAAVYSKAEGSLVGYTEYKTGANN